MHFLDTLERPLSSLEVLKQTIEQNRRYNRYEKTGSPRYNIVI